MKINCLAGNIVRIFCSWTKIRSGTKRDKKKKIIQVGFYLESIFQWPTTLSLFSKLHGTWIGENLEFILYEVKSKRNRHKISLRKLEIILFFLHMEIEEAAKQGRGEKRGKRKGEKINCTSQKICF